MQELILWPPPYKVKKHRLARSVKLRTSFKHGLEITTPFRFNLKNIPLILEEHKEWILTQLAQIKPFSPDILPTDISFPATGESWHINYVAATAKFQLIERTHIKEIVLMGNLEDKVLCKQYLHRWIKKQSARYLLNELTRLSQQTQLSFSKLSVRDQQTRWGSCTSDKAISLNYKLIFLPPELAAYVILHELSHTQHLDHSTRFWALLAVFDPAYKLHRQRLRHADQYIPAWLSLL